MCNGCGQTFDWLSDDDRCGACQDRDNSVNAEWIQCGGCGRTFQYLKTGTRCGACVKKDTDHGRISSVMAHPPNPRSRDIFIPPAMPSLIQNPERQYQAQQILMSLDASHSNARAFNPTGIVAKSKVRGVQNTDPTLEFKLSKLIIAQVGDVDLNTNTRINAMTHFANESDPVWDAIETLLLSVNRHLMKRHGFMVTRDQITVIYTNSGTEVPEHLVEGDTSVGQLWAASRGTLLSKKDRADRVMNLIFQIKVPNDAAAEDNTYLSTLAEGRGQKKRRASDVEDGPEPKRAAIGQRAPGYRSILPTRFQSTRQRQGTPPPARLHLTVSRMDMTYMTQTGENRSRFIRDRHPEALEIEIDVAPSQKGTMKQMFKITLDNATYAAKELFSIGTNTVPTHDENYDFLEAEMGVQVFAANILAEFIEEARAAQVVIPAIRVAKPFLLEVKEGDHMGRAFLVDPLLSNSNVVKYSGSDKAGSNKNTDLYGLVCNAFAHFSLCYSLVLVDIQGIKERTFLNGVRGPDELVLFDLMMHSANNFGALGDKGPAGIDEFKAQHKCNHICRAVSLSPTNDTEAGAESEPEDLGGSDSDETEQ